MDVTTFVYEAQEQGKAGAREIGIWTGRSSTSSSLFRCSCLLLSSSRSTCIADVPLAPSFDAATRDSCLCSTRRRNGFLARRCGSSASSPPSRPTAKCSCRPGLAALGFVRPSHGALGRGGPEARPRICRSRLPNAGGRRRPGRGQPVSPARRRLNSCADQASRRRCVDLQPGASVSRAGRGGPGLTRLDEGDPAEGREQPCFRLILHL